MGDVFAPLLSFGSTHDVVKYCRKLIDVCGEGGGFILSSGCTIRMNAKFENVKAIIDTAKTYGVYRN
jgi:uroporphyrinogen-III decarboxylase